MAPTPYRLEASAPGGGVLLSSVPFRAMTFGWVVNGPGTFECVCNLRDAGITVANLHPWVALRVYKGGSGTPAWGGFLTTARVSGRETLQLGGAGWWEHFRHREIKHDLVFRKADGTSADQSEIAWSLIASAQSDFSIGVTRGTVQATGSLMDQVYCAVDRPNVAQEVEQLASAIDGFDLEITPGLVFNAWHPRKQSASSLSLVVGDGGNVMEAGFGFEMDGTDMATEFASIGPRKNCASDTLVEVSGGVNSSGLLQDSAQYEVKGADRLQALADEQVRNRGVPRTQFTVMVKPEAVPALPAFSVGDTATVSASRGWMQSAGTYRIVDHQVVLDGYVETVRLVLDSVVS